MSASDLKLPPEGCPNDGICLTILPRLRAVEEDVKTMRPTANRVEHIEVVMAERDKTSQKIWSAMLCLIGLSVVHFCAFLVWVGGTTERLAAFKEINTAQDAAIFRLQQAEHGIKP